QQNFFAIVNVAEMKLDHFLRSGLDSASDERRINRKLSMATIYQHAQLHLTRAPLAKERVHGSASCASGVQNVVNNHNFFPSDRRADICFLYHGLRERRKIVAIERDVKRANRNRGLFNSLNHLADTLGQENAAPADAD